MEVTNTDELGNKPQDPLSQQDGSIEIAEPSDEAPPSAGETDKVMTDLEQAPAAEEAVSPRERPQVTFMGNSIDLISGGAILTGGIILFSCLTCNMGYYCMPVIPVVLGFMGLISAHQAVDAKRTRLWSWLGIGAGGIILLLMLAVIGLYVSLIAGLMVLGTFE